MIISISIALHWLGMAAIFGVAEAYYFYHLNQAVDKRGRAYDHAFLTAIRSSFAAALLLIVYLAEHSIWHVAHMLLFMLLTFPFIHDGVYYSTRNYMLRGTYPDGWWSNTDGRALFDLNARARTITFLIAVVMFILFTIMQ